MADLVTYDRQGLVSTLTMDDGKVNVFSFDMLRSLHEAFDQAERDDTVVRLRGRPGYFSAGFDLKVLRDGGMEATRELLTLGATLAERILLFPAPVVIACTGHAFPAGAFLLMAADERIGTAGPFKLGLNEVRIGLTLPWFAIVLARHRLTPTAFDRASVTGTMFDPEGARAAGLLDAVVAPEVLESASGDAAADLATIDRRAHAGTKRRARQGAAGELRAAIESELAPGRSPGDVPSGPYVGELDTPASFDP
jgi:enoyl-CoA hydratase